MDYILEIEKALGINSKKNFLDLQDGDVKETSSNSDLLYALTGFRVQTSLKQGVSKFISWYKSYYNYN